MITFLLTVYSYAEVVRIRDTANTNDKVKYLLYLKIFSHSPKNVLFIISQYSVIKQVKIMVKHNTRLVED